MKSVDLTDEGTIHDLPTWLVVGASGRVGRLVRAGWRINPPAATILPQFRTVSEVDGLRWSPLDGLAPIENLRDRGVWVDALVVLAGIVPGRPDTDFADDARIADACLAAAHSIGIRRSLVASSAAVYGRAAGLPVREVDTPCPVTVYGEAKLATEDACRQWRERGLDVTTLRIGNVAGADSLLGQPRVTSGLEIALDRFPDGRGPLRSYIDPVTLADVLGSLAAAAELPPVLNVAAPGEVAMAGLLDAAGLRWRWQDAPPAALQRLVLDCGALESFHVFPADAASPARIVAAWREAAS